jgi:PilZ domain
MSVHSKMEPARRTERKRVLMIGTVITCGASHRVRIRDFSSKGAQVVAESAIDPKCDVLLKRGDLCAAAHVAWIKGDEVGLTFYRPISAEELARI